MNIKELEANNWEKSYMLKQYGGFIQYKKEINGFYYVLTDMSSGNSKYITTNWSDWVLHIDDNKHQTVCHCEVKNLSDIYLFTLIFK